jgi:serine/threonine-protein kinase RsbW
MFRMKLLNGHSNLNTQLARTSAGERLLEVDAWIPSEITAISPLVDRLMRLIEGAHCITGQEHDVELALREALSNAVIHGNRLIARKLVHVRCRCDVGKAISLIVSDQGQGFDAQAIPDLRAFENREVEQRRGIQLIKSAMDEVSFQEGGTEVHMCKTRVRNPRTGACD